MYHILSLSLGALGLAAGAAAIGAQDKAKWGFLSLVSCNISILCQLRELARLAKIEEASAFFDTAPASALVATALLIFTALLNLIALFRRK